jgi:rRNA maturation protein Nop10
MSSDLSKRIEISCHACGEIHEISVPSDVVSWEYKNLTGQIDFNFKFKCPDCGRIIYIKLIQSPQTRDDTRAY